MVECLACIRAIDIIGRQCNLFHCPSNDVRVYVGSKNMEYSNSTVIVFCDLYAIFLRNVHRARVFDIDTSICKY